LSDANSVEVTNDRRKSKELYITIGLTFIYFTGFMMLSPILPLYIVKVGASKFELGILMAILSGTTIFARIPFGFVSERIGRWVTLLIALCLQLFAFLLYSVAFSIIHLYLITALYALSFASFGPVSIAIALDSAMPSIRGLVMGRYYTSIGTSMIFGPLLGGFLTLYLDYRQLMFVASLLPLLGIISFLALYFRGNVETFSRKSRISHRAERIHIKSLLRVIRSRNIFAICCAQIAFFIASGVFRTLFSIYAEEYLWLTASTISILFAIRGVPNAIVRIPIGSLSVRIGRQKPLILGFALCFLALFLIPQLSSIAIIGFLMAIYGVAWGIRTAPTAALMGDNVKSADINIASALIWLTSDVGTAVGSFIAGYATLFLEISNILMISSLSLLGGIFTLSLIKEGSAHALQ
jgi:DHA1 family multidrug resistance protein-like MFS transporter